MSNIKFINNTGTPLTQALDLKLRYIATAYAPNNNSTVEVKSTVKSQRIIKLTADNPKLTGLSILCEGDDVLVVERLDGQPSKSIEAFKTKLRQIGADERIELLYSKKTPVGSHKDEVKSVLFGGQKVVSNQQQAIPNLAAYKGKAFMFMLRESDTHLRIVAGAGLKLTQDKTSVWNKQGKDITPLVAQLLGVEHREGKGIFISSNPNITEIMAIVTNIINKLNSVVPYLVTAAFITNARGGRINERGQRV